MLPLMSICTCVVAQHLDHSHFLSLPSIFKVLTKIATQQIVWSSWGVWHEQHLEAFWKCTILVDLPLHWLWSPRAEGWTTLWFNRPTRGFWWMFSLKSHNSKNALSFCSPAWHHSVNTLLSSPKINSFPSLHKMASFRLKFFSLLAINSIDVPVVLL